MHKKKLYQPHYSTATDARIVQTREALGSALLELVADKPLEQITIREITARARIGYNTFFRHYRGKEELVRHVVADEITRLIELSVTTLDSSSSSGAALAVCRFVAEHDALWSTLLTGGAANTVREEFIRLLREKAPSRVSDATRMPVEIGIHLVAVGTLELLAWWLQQPQRMAVEDVAAIYEELVVAPVVQAYST